MIRRSKTPVSTRLAIAFLAVVLLASCSFAPHRYEPLEDFDITARAEEQVEGALRVRASVPGEDEAERLFGIPLYDRGIQPVWLEVSNQGDKRARLTLTSIDPKYFSPLEVAYIHRKRLSKDGWRDLEAYLLENAMPRQIGPQETVSGFVFTNLNRGTKAFNVDIFTTDGSNAYQQFTFFVEVPGFVPDHAEVDFTSIYPATQVQDVDLESLRALLHEFPCCTSNRSGEGRGRPVNLFFVSEGKDLLRALLRAGWSETAYTRSEAYLDTAEHYFGREPDAIFRKGSNRTTAAIFRKGSSRSTERFELALWLAPVQVSGQPLWVGQVRHALGRLFDFGESIFGVNLDPDTSDGQYYMMQDLWYSQSLKHWAWSTSGIAVPPENPVTDFNGEPWFTRDEFRLVLWISDRPVSVAQSTAITLDRIYLEDE
jgi:hypothetical protein